MKKIYDDVCMVLSLVCDFNRVLHVISLGLENEGERYGYSVIEVQKELMGSIENKLSDIASRIDMEFLGQEESDI